MAKTYFRCDLSQVKATNRGGRLHSAKATTELPNGVLGYLGGHVSGSTEVRELLAPTAELIKTKLPVIVMKPEINYKQDTKKDGALGIFRNPANKPLPVVPLVDLDGIDLSEDYLDLTGKGNQTIENGDIFVLQENLVAGTQLKYSASAPLATAAGFYLKVIGIVNSHTANYIFSDGTGVAARFPQAYKIVQLELISQL